MEQERKKRARSVNSNVTPLSALLPHWSVDKVARF